MTDAASPGDPGDRPAGPAGGGYLPPPVGTHLLDGSVGEAFFGDSMRMHRDLLGDAATQYLPRLLP